MYFEYISTRLSSTWLHVTGDAWITDSFLLVCPFSYTGGTNNYLHVNMLTRQQEDRLIARQKMYLWVDGWIDFVSHEHAIQFTSNME